VHAVVESEFLLEVEGLVFAFLVFVTITSCGHVTTHPAQPVHNPVVITSLYSSFHWAVQRSALAGEDSVTVMDGNLRW